MSSSITPTQEKTAFYEGVGTLTLPQVNNPYYISVSDVSKNASTVIDTTNGSFIGLGTYGQGRVAVVGNTGYINEGLRADPGNGGWARGLFNLYSWVSDTSRGVGQTDKLYVLRTSDTGANNGFNSGISENQSLFLDYLAAETSYAAAGANGASVTGLTTAFTSAGSVSEALLTDGAWSRHYGVVEIPSNAGADMVSLVEQWITATGGGVIVDCDTAYTISTDVRNFVNSLGLSISTNAGPSMPAGDYTPAKVDPKNTDIVFKQLTGVAPGTFGQNSSSPILIQDSVKLPTEIMGGTVTWTTSAAGTLTAAGVAGTDGTATLSAHVTFEDGTTQDQSIYYRLFHPTAGTGLERRIIDTTGFTVGGNTPGDTDINAFMDSTLLSKTPVNDVTGSSPNWNSSTDAWPNNSYHQTLWTYSGYLMPAVTGSYSIKLTADDSAKLYIEHDGQITSQSVAYWSSGAYQTVNLEAGKAYRVWVFFKPSSGGANNVAVQWQAPGSASYVTIPSSAYAQYPSGLVPSSGGYPAALLPWGNSSSSINKTTSQIISDTALTTLEGNKAPTAANQQFNLQKNGLYFNPQDMRFTDAVAAQVKTVCLRALNADGTTSFFLNNVALSGVTDGASLATAIQALVTPANAVSGSSGTVTVTYSNNLLKVTDTAGRKMTSFILAKQGSNVVTVNSAPDYSAAGKATVGFDLNRVHEAVRLSFSLAANGSGPAVGLADLMFQGVGYGDPANLAPFLQNAVRAAMGNSDVTITWNQTGSDPLIGNLIFTDAKGRVFSNLALTNQSKYAPLVEMAGPSTGGGASPSVATIGGISGTAFASDANNNALTYAVLEQPKFGTVTLDSSSGKYFYQPTAGGAFQGFDQFTLQATDSVGAKTSPFSITITNEEAPQVAVPVAKTYTIPDPVYTEPAARLGVNLPADWQFKDVFIAQTHVQRPTDPYLELTQNRYALVKLNGISASGAAAPDFTVYVTDANGNSVGSLRLTGPANLPTSVNLPTLANYGQGLQSDADSYTAPLPSAWVKPGMNITIMATGSATPITTFSPKVGSDLNLNLSVMSLSMHGINDGAYMAGIENWAQQALVNLPAGSITLYEYPFLNINTFGKEQSGVWGNYTGDNSGLPGSDPLPWDGGFQGVIGYAIHMAGQLRAANGGYGSIVYMADHVEPGGGLGGGSIGGGGPSPGIFWHEVMGHGEGRGHAAADSAYPYNNVTPTGSATQSGWLGPNWGYNQVTGQYQSTSVLNTDNTITLYTDPQAGGVQNHPGNNFGMFSDYYSYLNHQYMDAQTQWVPDNTLAGATGDGAYQSWDSTNQRWVTSAKTDPNTPVQHDVPVYWLSMNLTTPQGAGASPGSAYADNLRVLPVRTVGNLSQPFHDIVTGAGRTQTDGDYVARVTYSTPTGLITDNLVIPSSYGTMYVGFNIPDKGELVRVDIVEAANANLDAYLQNNVVASYVNSNALANLVFKGDASFSAGGTLNLPTYFNGAKVDWSSTISGLINLSTGAIDGTKLTAGADIKAQWVENGVLQTRTFALNLPDSYLAMKALFGKTTDATSPVGYYVVNNNLTLPTTVFGATVNWTSSNPSVITASGQILGQGAAYLKATLTYPNGAVRTYGMNYYAQPEAALTRTTPYVMNELFGQDYKSDTVTDPRFVSSNLTLPTTIDHGTVTWSSSNTAALSNSGQVVRSGLATLTASVTFDDGTHHNYSLVYNVQSEYSLTTRTPYVMNELFGAAFSSDTITDVKVVTDNLTLPATVDHGTVAWSSSNTAVISNTGQLLAFGTATMTATVSYSDGTSHSYSRLFYAEPGIGIMTSTGYVMNQLFGTAFTSKTVTDPLVVSTSQTLPATIDHGTVSWATSNAAVISAAGAITGSGSATLTATVTFDNGSSGTYSRAYFVAGERYFTTSVPYVMNELFGTAYSSSTVTDPKLVFADLTLPTTIDHGTVAWSSSNTGVINNSGQLVGSGQATLTATVTFDDSTTRTYSVVYYAMTEKAAAMATPYVMNQLFGYSYSQANLTDTKMINSALSLPATVDHGTVVWTSSNTAILSNAGAPVATGQATLTATVTFDNGTSQTYSRPYYSVVDGTGLTTGGLLFRAVDATGYKSVTNGAVPADTAIDSFLTSDLTSKVPIASIANQYPNWNKTGGYPTGTSNAGGMISGLWSYTGFVLPTSTGTYQFNIKADDSIKLLIMKDGVLSSVSATWSDSSGVTLSIDLTGGKAYPIWIYYHGNSGTGANSLAVTWKSPSDASFVNIPTSQLAGTPSSLVSSTAGVANGLLPFAATMDSFNSGLGLQVRLIDLTGFSYTNTASGMDHYISPEVLATTPIFSGTALPKWSRPTGYNGSWATYVPSVLRNSSGYIKDSLWVYSGFFVAKTAGSYQFKITADDNGRLYMGASGSTQKADNNGTITMTLAAGQTVPMWVYYKNVDPTSQDATYWPDSINVQYMKPGDAAFSDIPADRLAPMPDALVPANAGYPTAQQPKITSANPFDTGVGLNLRVVDLTGYTYTNTASGMDHYLTADVLGTTPIWSGTAVPNYLKGVAVYGNVAAPNAIRDASGYVKESLWTYSGYILPKVSGSYNFRLTADDDGRMYIGAPGSVQKVNAGGTVTMTLTAGQVVPVWVFFKSGAANSYWADQIKLDWTLPGAGSYTDIPADRFAPMPDAMLPANAGYPTSQLPFALGDAAFQRGTGLQYRVIDLTGYTDTTGIAGFDKWLAPAVLDKTPIFSGTMNPYWSKGDALPNIFKSADGYAKDSFWAFTGYVLPQVTGTYGISFTADDYGRMYIGGEGQVQSIYHEVNGGNAGTININMTAGVPVPISVFFKTQPPDGYWSDWVQVQWKLPGAASYTTIPTDRYAPVSDSLISPTGGYPQSMIPKVTSANPFDTGLGLNLRVVDLTGLTFANNAVGISKYIAPDVLGRTPIYSGVAVPNYLKGVAVYGNVAVPAALRDANQQVKESLWTYSGYIMPKSTGTYKFRLTADDCGVAYIGQPGSLQQVNGGGEITMNLTAGQVVPVWIFYKNGPAGDYWADQIKLDWTLPGAAAYSDIPKESLAPLPDSLLPANAGYPAAQLPNGMYDFAYNRGNGLQLRVVDLTNYTYTGSASGMDRYLTADVLGQTPIFSGVALPNYFKDVAQYNKVDVPNAIRNSSGFVRMSLWSYSGYILPKTTGTYSFQLSADDGARVYIGKPGQVQSGSSYVQGSAATITMNLTAGDVIPVWVFFQSGPPDSYWADWVTLKWQTPGSVSFVDIPANQLSPISDTLVAPTGGYPSSLLPFVLNPTLSVASTQALPGATFLAVSSAAATVLPLTPSSKTVSDQPFVSGSHFTQQITVPATFGNANMTRWVKLLVKKADGSVVEQDPIQPWTSFVSGTTMTVKGVIDSTPDIVVTGVKVYADDNSFDSVAPATAIINVNAAPGTVTLSANTVTEKQVVGTTVGTLSVTGGNGTDTFTYSIVPSTNHTGDSTFFTLDGSTLKTQRVFDAAVKATYTLRLRATNSAGFWTEKDVTISIAQQSPVTPATTFLVTSTADTNTSGTLRYAINQANAVNTGLAVIRFDSSFATAKTINLASQLPQITNSRVRVQIFGPGSSLLTINGGGASSDYQALLIGSASNGSPSVLLSGMTISNFRRLSDGGAIKNYGQLVVDDVAFRNNSAPGYTGGAIYTESVAGTLYSGNVLVTNSTFSGNTAASGAALATNASVSSETTIRRSTFSTNTATVNGGAIYFAAHLLALENVTIASNTAASGGGGIYSAAGSNTSLLITSSTIANNTATASQVSGTSVASAGGVQLRDNASMVILNDSIIAKNTAASASSDVVGLIDAGTGNLIGNGNNMLGLTNGKGNNQVGTNATPIDPLLGTLASNGGLTQTLALLTGSPAIDAGDSAATTADQCGTARTQGARPDIGAYELVMSNAAPAITGQPASVAVTSGVSASFSVTSTSTPSATIQWYVSGDRGATWSSISGATNAAYSFTSSAADNGKQYRAVLTNSVGSLTSSSATLTVNYAPALSSSPASSSVLAGDTAAFRLGLASNPAPAIQWQVNSGSGWSDITGATADYLLVTAASADNGNQYRALVTNSQGTITSSAATLTVNSAPLVTTQPSNASVFSGSTATFTVAATGTPTPTVQWQVNSGSGWVDISGAINASYSTAATASSDNGKQYRAVFTNALGTATTNAATLTVTAVGSNSAPTDIALSASSIAENAGANATVGTLSTTDPDSGNTFTYTLVSGAGSTDNASFAIVGNTLQAVASFDYEAKSSYTVRVRSTDQGGLSFEKAFTISVTNVNETPSDIALSSVSIAENAGANATVGTLSTTDPDAGNTFTYTLVSGSGSTDNASFAIIGNTLKAIASFDYETKNSYTVRVRSTDQGGLSFEKAFTISVTNVNETPTNIALSASQVTPSNMAGGAVGTLSTTDPDTGNTFTYSLVNGTGSTDNASFTISGGTLQTVASVNYSSKSSYSVLIRSTDQGGLYYEKSFSISSTVTAPAVTTQPSNSTVSAGNTASFTVAASGNPIPTVQWQVSSGSGWANISGATSLTYTTPATVTGDTGKQYRAVFTSSVGSATSNAATLTVNAVGSDLAPSITTQPASATVQLDGTVTFSAAATGTPAPTVQWQVNSGSGWVDLEGVTTGDYTTDAATVADNGKQYRAVFTNSAGTATTNTAVLSVQYAPIFSVQPADRYVATGSTGSFSFTAAANPAPTAIQWQLSTNGGSTWSNISGATGTSFTTSAFAVADNGLAYRALVTNSLGTTTSDTARLNYASLVVTSTSDADVVRGSVSLRQALAYAGTFASGTATVSLDASLTASPLTLNLGKDLLLGSKAGASVVLAGPGANKLTLQGGGPSSNYGGVGLLQGTVTVSGVTITGFHTNFGGGGVVNVLGGTLNLLNVAVVNNAATDPSYDTYGGGVFNAGTLNVSGSTFSGGSASYGGAIYNIGTLSVSGSTFVNNTASIAGGAIYNELGGSVTLTGDTFSMNSAPTGGGIANTEGSVTLRNVIVANNTAATSGPDLSGNITANFSLLGNTTGAALTGSNNTIGVNPLFGPLGTYGGKTQVLPLLPGSPAIDSGYGSNITDQRGFAVSGPADMGAFQSRGFNVTPAAGTAQKVMIGDYFASNLTLSVASSFGEPVNGGVATFTVPTGANLPSAVLTGSTTITGGQVSLRASANAFYGSAANQRYNVLGTTSGALAPAAFELLNVGAPSNVTATAGNYQSGDFNSNFTTPISFSVKDSVGNNLNGIAVSFRTVGTSYGANGTINGGSLVSGTSDANGTYGNITFRSNAVGGLVDIVANATVGASAVAGIRQATTATGHAYEGTVGINVQNGTAGRSFINSVSGLFGNAALATSLNAGGNVKIQYLGYSGTDTPVDVTSTVTARAASGNNVNWTFGPLTGTTTGITGDPNSANGDGVYQVAVDYNNDGVFETAVKFHRLFGDVNGDAVVDTIDYNKVMSSAVYGKYNVYSGENTNGQGQVYTKDITTVLRQRGRNISYKKY